MLEFFKRLFGGFLKNEMKENESSFDNNSQNERLSDDIKMYITALSDKSMGSQRSVPAGVLGKLGIVEAIEPLSAILKDKEEYYSLRANCAKALGDIRNERAVDVLVEALGDEDFSVQYETVYALGRIGSKRAVQGLINYSERNDIDDSLKRDAKSTANYIAGN
ncbi:MAG: HEAT repeat domain-containing protein [Pseudomonadota bacterium]